MMRNKVRFKTEPCKCGTNTVIFNDDIQKNGESAGKNDHVPNSEMFVGP